MIYEDERLDEINDSLKLIQKKDGLTFGTDAFLLYAYLRKKRRACAADLGSGTGIISLLAANRSKFERIYAIEVQKSFSELIVRNVELNALQDSVSVLACDVRELSVKDIGREVDVVFSNPPYMTTTSGFHNEHSEKFIARHEVMGNIGDFCAAAKRILKFGGSCYVVYRPDRIVDLMQSLRSNQLEPKRMTYVYNSPNHAPSLVLLEAKKGAAPGLFVTKPFIMTDCDGNETQELKEIYINGEFDECYEQP